METCEDRLHPAAIIERYKTHHVVKKIIEKKNSSVLDIGCRVPIFQYVLFHDFNFKIFIGVEKSTERFAVEEFIRAGKKQTDRQSKTIYGIYKNKNYFWLDEEEALRLGTKYLTKPQFHRTFKVKWKTTALKYLSELNVNTRFDYLIFSDILPLIQPPERNQIFQMATAALNKGGLIYVKANHQENPIATRANQFTFNAESFLELFRNYRAIHICKNMEADGKSIHSLLYFGCKK